MVKYVRRSRQKKKLSGICLDCSAKAEVGKLRCTAHLEKQAYEAMIRRYSKCK